MVNLPERHAVSQAGCLLMHRDHQYAPPGLRQHQGCCRHGWRVALDLRCLACASMSTSSFSAQVNQHISSSLTHAVHETKQRLTFSSVPASHFGGATALLHCALPVMAMLLKQQGQAERVNACLKGAAGTGKTSCDGCCRPGMSVVHDCAAQWRAGAHTTAALQQLRIWCLPTWPRCAWAHCAGWPGSPSRS